MRINANSRFVSNYEKEDNDFRIMRKILLSGIRNDNLDEIEKQKNFCFVGNQYKKTGIGYYVKYNYTEKYMNFTIDATKLLNMELLHPKNEENFETFVHPDSEFTIFAMKHSTYDKYWFNVSVGNVFSETPFDNDPNDGEEKIFLRDNLQEPLVNEEILSEFAEDSFYDYIFPTMEEAKLKMSFNTLDMKAITKEQFYKEYPEHMIKLEEIPEEKKFAENEWKKMVYDNGTYIGQVDSSDARSGKGIYIFESGSYITGIYVGNVKNGFFKEYTEFGKLVFEGIYVKGQKNGKGKYIFNNGSFYDGDFKNDVRHGFGEYCFPSGQKYVGNWVDGKKEGKGCYYYSENEYWDGFFSNNTWNGTGVYHWANGNTSEITYKNGERV